MSETLRESDESEVASSNGNGAIPSAAPGHRRKPSTLSAVKNAAPAIDIPVEEPRVDAEPSEPVTTDQVDPSPSMYVAEIELRLGELVQIEKMRDLEIHHLEAELEEQADLARGLETALFHAERRATDLEKRWNDLAGVYETAAAALVVAGGQLEQIHQQAGYRAVLAISRAFRRYPAVYRRVRWYFHRYESS